MPLNIAKIDVFSITNTAKVGILGKISLVCGLQNSQFVAYPQFVSRFINSFFSDRIFNSFKFFKFLKFFNPFYSFLWIATKSQATSRNDGVVKIHKIHSKIHKFSVIANELQGEVWQSIVKVGFVDFTSCYASCNTFFATQKTASPQPPRSRKRLLAMTAW